MEAPKCKNCGKHHWERACPDIVCTACGGKGEFDEDDEPIEEEDFGEAFGP